MCKLFDEWAIEIKKYCKDNGFDFEKAQKLSKSWSKNDLVLQHYDETKKLNGLLDETPMPIVLIIKKEDNGLVFTQTEHTERYLHKAS